MVELNFQCPEGQDAIEASSDSPVCIACNKTLIDYTGLSPSEVKSTLEANSGSCGVFRSDQLSNSTKTEMTSAFRLAFAMVFVLGLSTTSLYAQESSTEIRTSQRIDGNTIISGTVISNKGKAVPNADISIYYGDSIYIIRSGEDGSYRLELDHKLSGSNLEIQVNASHHSANYFLFTSFEGSIFELPLQLTKIKRKKRNRYSGGFDPRLGFK